MANDFARIFTVRSPTGEDTQLLVTVQENDSDDGWNIDFRTQLPSGAPASFVISFSKKNADTPADPEATAREIFMAIDKDCANDAYRSILSLVEKDEEES